MQSILKELPQREVNVAVPAASMRLGLRGVTNTVYSRDLPPRSFVDLDDGVRISSPELLFVELAPLMGPSTHLLLGHELCGTFSRDAADPRDGNVTLGVRPATSVSLLQSFVDECHGIPGVERARETLSLLHDNAWSPFEAILATQVSLPVYYFGYGCADLTLNERIAVSPTASRVPDIMFNGTCIGLNYDGGEHLDLASIEAATRDAARLPASTHSERFVEQAKRAVRSKVIDDLRRNRDLSSRGRLVLPVTKEDLYESGGLDRLMLQVYETMQHFSNLDMSDHISCLVNPRMAQRRQHILWALMPGERGKRYLRYLLPEQ